MPNLPDSETNTNTEVEFDTSEALAELSSDLFGQDEEGEGGGKDETEVEAPEVPGTSPPVEPPAPQEPTMEENSAEVQALGAPSTWSKEGLADWAKIPPSAQQEILKREADMFKGIEQYKEKAELGTQYDKVVEPYRPLLAAENIDPVQLFNAFAGNHYLLTRGTPEQKLELAANMMQHYGIDPTALVMRLGNAPPPPDPALVAVQNELAEIKRHNQTQLQAQQSAQLAEFTKQVEAFALDPANIYFNDVSANMKTLLDSRVATTLQQAYEMAVYNNPTTRQKELDRLTTERMAAQIAEKRGTVEAAKIAMSADVKTSPRNRSGTTPAAGSMDDTLNETMAAIQARG